MEPASLHIAQIVVPTRELDLAKSFYKDVIGLTHLFDAPNVCAFKVDDIRLLLTAQPNYAPPPSGVVFYFSTQDIMARHLAWIERGARDGGAPQCIARLGVVEIWIAFVLDPSGNTLGLIEEREV